MRKLLLAVWIVAMLGWAAAAGYRLYCDTKLCITNLKKGEEVHHLDGYKAGGSDG